MLLCQFLVLAGNRFWFYLEEPVRVASTTRINLEEPVRVASTTRINLEEPGRVHPAQPGYTCFAWAGGTCPRFAWVPLHTDRLPDRQTDRQTENELLLVVLPAP